MSRYQNWFKIYYQAQTRQFTEHRRYGELAYISLEVTKSKVKGFNEIKVEQSVASNLLQ